MSFQKINRNDISHNLSILNWSIPFASHQMVIFSFLIKEFLIDNCLYSLFL